ncbi:MAG TPA: type III pantothenate kinase [Candidatus Hydrogenedentes bacterium]|mgnify:FL=1|nr:type III pantothenate kinase [Candidatus Hydrogenedentota bacterium]HOJ67574.1 type III pantothenate kinase [Candidatus Hydrogenedentota bacterium]HOK89845.1 type III pantothenate kinase [Candidatus Hydrogenedentota bacterium]HOV61298.1 type III pantothenate kinase [Candidatus Hydrogenedentota bacterium]
MLLVVDAGNTHTVLGLFAGDQFRGHWRIVTSNYRTSDELGLLLHMLLDHIGVKPEQISGCCVSSVVPQWNPALVAVSRQFFGIEPLMVEPGVKTGLVLQCDNPREVGADRIVNAVGALEEHEGPLIILDFGTATTFDAVTRRREWIGGVIVPGIQLSADALFEHCAKLPRVDIVTPRHVIGRDTVTNIRSGLTYGYADMVDGLVRRMRKEMEEPRAKVIATGGLAGEIARVARSIDLVDPLLTLKGLRAVYRKNIGETGE